MRGFAAFFLTLALDKSEPSCPGFFFVCVCVCADEVPLEPTE